MSLIGFSYLIFLGISVLVYWTVIPPKFRSLFLLFCSALFLCSYNFCYPLLFFFMGALVYAGGKFISCTESEKKKKLVFILLLFLLISVMCFYKYFSARATFKSRNVSTASGYSILFGLSFIIFRLIHYLIESYRKNIPASSRVDFISYIIFFPTFLAGPVERFKNFHAQTSAFKAIAISEVNYGLFRLLCGIFKKAIIADNLAALIMPVLSSPQGHARPIVLLSIYGFSIQLYMDFSGYTDMAIGAARLFGYKIMENFNRPFLQKNIAMFWRNWHISVYSWIRDYFFFPVFGWRVSKAKTYLGIFFSMIVFTLWHRGNLNFLILGSYHGLALVIWNVFQEEKRKFPVFVQLTSNRYLGYAATFATFSFVSFGLIFFRDDFSQSVRIIQRLFNYS